jgi:hypothetical protein
MSDRVTPTRQRPARWFQRTPLTDSISRAHVFFPIVYDGSIPRCLCVLCSPAESAEHEEKLQTAYVKAIEHELSCLAYVLKR